MKDKIFTLITQEENLQEETINLIPSENYCSVAVKKTLGSVLTDKYAEGYPKRRYYQGNKIVDEVENLAIQRAKSLFGVPYVNVQPYSGSTANMAVYFTLANPGEKVMGMDLKAGGHLTHGAPVNFSGKFYKVVSYGVNSDGWLDYEEIENLAKRHRPKIIWCGATAYPRFFDWQKFAKIAEKVGAWLVADIAHYAGLIVGGVYPSPVSFADILTTTTHKTLRGPRGAMIMVTKKGLKKDKNLGEKINRWVFPGLQGGPHENNIAGIAVALAEAKKPSFKKYAQQVIKNAQVLAEELIKFGFKLVTGGTDNHLLLIDLRNKKISGKETAVILEKVGIIVNANSIPNDPGPPLKPSGIRLGTPAVTTRGMKEKEMKLIANFIYRAIEFKEDEKELQKIKNEVKRLTSQFRLRF
ncbi:MAG: serine hydroxymethyltransferase [Microgenomates group bacterium]